MVTSGMSPLYSIPTSPTTHLPRMHPCLEMAKREQRVHSFREGDGPDDDGRATDLVASANTVEYYTSMLENYDETQFTRKIYADASERLQGWIERLWYG